MREKMIELLTHDDCPIFMVFGDNMEGLVDYLIAHGVTIPVRCKDCKRWVKADNGSWRMIGRTDGICKMLVNVHNSERYMTEGEHFCSYGERKDNG